jgi:hypothetical protein
MIACEARPPVSETGRSWLVVAGVTAASAIFVAASTRALPDVVASHFASSGTAKGYMDRSEYLRFVLALVIALPILFTALPSALLSRPYARVHVPNRGYWLAPERRANTIAYLRRHLARLGIVQVLFVCGMHGLLLRANAVVPAHLAPEWFIGALGGLLVSMLFWATRLMDRFRLP